jgi:Trk K+ transport system NAD-binding subunit
MPHRQAAKAVRYGFYVLRELKVPLAVLVGLVLLGGLVFRLSLPNLTYGKACWAVFMMITGEPTLDYPDRWYDQVLFFAIPFIGLGALAESLVRLGYLVFTSKRKVQEWWIMEASTLRDHVVLCGLGRVGYRVAQELLALKEPFAVVERNKDCPFADEILDRNVPVLFGEARHRKILELANVARAKAVILATDDDLANLDGALTAREIKPDIRVVVRLFDDTLATKVASSFKLPAISTSHVAAPAFVAAATGRNVLHAFQLDGRTMNVADLRVERLAGRSPAELQREFEVSVVSAAGGANPDRKLQPGDTIVGVAPAEHLRRLEEANRA